MDPYCKICFFSTEANNIAKESLNRSCLNHPHRWSRLRRWRQQSESAVSSGRSSNLQRWAPLNSKAHYSFYLYLLYVIHRCLYKRIKRFWFGEMCAIYTLYSGFSSEWMKWFSRLEELKRAAGALAAFSGRSQAESPILFLLGPSAATADGLAERCSSLEVDSFLQQILNTTGASCSSFYCCFHLSCSTGGVPRHTSLRTDWNSLLHELNLQDYTDDVGNKETRD